MASRVLYSDEYDREIAQGTLAPETFDYRILCEGDSWMDRSSIFQLSLPWALAQTFHGTKGNDALFINLARFGDTLRGIADCGDALFDQWLDTDGVFRFDALLFSASGNDFIAAALEPGSGNGILHGVHGVHGAPPGLQADDCYNVDAVADLVTSVIDPSFDAIYRRVRTSRNPDLPILLNCYNMPVAPRRWHCCRRPREAPAAAATGSTRSIRTSRDGPGSRRPGRRNWTRSSDSSPLQF